ncbi:hypothetical protein AAIB33_10385 [Microbacterium sp. AZCO]|uniref:hypothetical protein n=1 Tax=Microbacterium sp. AZCO TaxID=3142976 RepID=UPI0031F45BAE
MRARLIAPVAGIVLALSLAGCGSTPSVTDATATRMQASVVSIAQAAADGDAAAAVTQLDGLQSQLDDAVQHDQVTAARAARIQSAIEVVRADLAALTAPAPTPEPVATTADTPATTTQDTSGSGGGNDKSGPGKNSGSGKGKGKDKG